MEYEQEVLIYIKVIVIRINERTKLACGTCKDTDFGTELKTEKKNNKRERERERERDSDCQRKIHSDSNTDRQPEKDGQEKTDE